jgi:hypothetical protein
LIHHHKPDYYNNQAYGVHITSILYLENGERLFAQKSIFREFFVDAVLSKKDYALEVIENNKETAQAA